MRVIIVIVIVFAALFVLTYSCSRNGYGYMGYYGYYRGPSFFYWGGPSYFYGPSVRSGSLGGPGVRGGGFRGGK